MVKLTPTDLKILYNAHPDLVLVILMAAQLSQVPFKVNESIRSVEQQKANIKKGVSWTMHSRHLPSADGKSRAVDIVPLDSDGRAVLSAWPVYFKLAPFIKAAAAKVGVVVEWGGDWKKTPDGPHWQLSWAKYP
jgi:peptidoglycan L-alanyl-D-glutamate endopeptidase CwlK